MRMRLILTLGAIVSLFATTRMDAVQNDRRDNRSDRDMVCVYKDINYFGAEQCFRGGDNIADLGILNKNISSIRVYGRSTVTIFEKADYGGHSAQFTSNVSDLGKVMMAGDDGWSDRVYSLKIAGETSNLVCVYKDINYYGEERCFRGGENIADLGGLKKNISSIRVYGRSTVTIYEKADYGGHSAQFTSNVIDLGKVMMSGNNGWSDRIYSLKIGEASNSDRASSGNSSREQPQPPRDGVCVYERPNFQGRWECWNQGESVFDLARQGDWNGEISSIRVLGGRTSVVVYRDVGYRGESLTVNRDLPDLSDIRENLLGNGNGRGRGNGRNSSNWDRQISSMQVQAER